MAYNIKDYFVETSAGNTGANAEPIHKFGHNDDVGSTYVPVTVGGIYRTPKFDAATTLRIKSGGNANDTAAGTGARKIHLQGLDANGAYIDEDVVTAGASASAATTGVFVRIFRAFVVESGTYATASAGSHTADIVIENSAGTEDWATIKVNGFAESQSGIAAYTVPAGKVAYVKQMYVSVAATKVASVIFFAREGADNLTAPYKAMRMQLELHNIENDAHFDPQMPFGPYPEFTDIGFLAKLSSGTGEVDADFEILLRDKE